MLVPQYVIFSELGWVNTLLPLVVPKFLATDAFFVFLMVQFVRGIPRELDEAARIDGAGHFTIFTRIILPLMIRAGLTSEVLLGRQHLAYAIALEMIVVVAIVMTAYALLLRRTARWLR